MISRALQDAASAAAFPDTYTTDTYSYESSSGSSAKERWSSLIGVVTAIVGNILISFALNMQRYAHIRQERESEERERKRRKRQADEVAEGHGTEQYGDANATLDTKTRGPGKRNGHADIVVEDTHEEVGEEQPLLSRTSAGRRSIDSQDTIKADNEEPESSNYLKSPYWWAGIIMMTVGEAGNFLAYGFAPASIVSPLGVVALISNCIVAPIMFKEVFRKRDFLGVIIAVGGAVTVVLSAKSDNPKLGPHEIWGAITRTGFEIYLGVTCGLIVTLMLLSNRYGGKSILIDLGLVGLFGGYTALSTKGVASLLSFKLWRLITFPVTYLLAFILIFTAVMQIKYINRALKRFDATQVIPTQFVMFTLSVILGSAVLYRDFERTTPEDAGKFVGGCVLTFAGVWLITSGRPHHDDDESRDPEPPDAISLAEGEAYREEDLAANSTPKPRHPTREQSRPPQTPPSTAPSIQISTHTSNDSIHTATPPTSTTTTTTPWLDSPFRASTHRPSTPTNLQRATTSPTPASASLSTPDLTLQTPRPPTTRTASGLILDTPLLATRLLVERASEPPPRNQNTRSSIAAGPAPLLMTSPLSGSLSAMVAELRRSASSRSAAGSPLRQRRSVGGGAPGAPPDEEAGLLHRVPTAASSVGSETEGAEGVVGRGRRLSSIFRGWIGDGEDGGGGGSTEYGAVGRSPRRTRSRKSAGSGR